MLLFTFSSNILLAQNLVPIDNESSVAFGIKNFGSTVNGKFTGVKGKIVFNPQQLNASSINVTIDAATINTSNGTRDKHLKKDGYFDVAKYPTIQFIATKIVASGSSYIAEGILTIKGISKNISLPFTATAYKGGYNFIGEISLNRRDFKVGSGSLILSDNLIAKLNIVARL